MIKDEGLLRQSRRGSRHKVSTSNTFKLSEFRKYLGNCLAIEQKDLAVPEADLITFWLSKLQQWGAMMLNSIAVWAFVFLFGLYPYLSEGAEVSSFSPTGTVKVVRQIRASFSAPMVPFGDPQAQIDPFDSVCAVPGKGRWIDQTNWVYDFNEDLPGGVQCKFTLRSGLKTLSGDPITGTSDYVFNTGGPSIRWSEPWDGSQVDEEQVFILTLDANVDPKAILQHVYFTVDGIQEKIPVVLLDEDPRETEKNRPKEFKSKVKYWARKIGLPTSLNSDSKSDQQVNTNTNANSNLGSTSLSVNPSNRANPSPALTSKIVLQAQRKFPPRAKIGLVWGAGIETSSHAVNSENQILSFVVRPDLAAEFSCDRENPTSACIPYSPMRVNFSASVSWAQARKVRLRSQTGQEWKPYLLHGQAIRDDEGVSEVKFVGPFPENTQFEVILPARIRDDAGRPLSNASHYPLAVATADFPPLIKFSASFGILELKPEAVLPVTVRNVEAHLKMQMSEVTQNLDSSETSTHSASPTHSISQSQRPQNSQTTSFKGKVLRLNAEKFLETTHWIKKIENAKREESIFDQPKKFKTEVLNLDKPNGEKASEVLGIPFKKAGFYVVEFESQRLGVSLLGKQAPMYVPAAALVTNLAVHFKYGMESSLIWVTTLDTAQPVDSAMVSVRDCAGKLLYEGKTNSSGIVRVNQELPAPETIRCSAERGSFSYSSGLYAIATKDDDFSFVHTSWQKGIEPWRYHFFGHHLGRTEYGSTVFDRTLLRAGETVHMKHFFRKHSGRGLEMPPAKHLPHVLQIQHEESKQTFELPLSWSRANVTAENSFTIPKNAKLGQYAVRFIGKPAEADSGRGEFAFFSGDFRVEEYRVPLMKGQIRPPSTAQIALEEIPVDFSVEYLSGGAASKLPVQVRYQSSRNGSISLKDYEGFEFGLGQVNSENNEIYEEESSSRARSTRESHQVSLTLDSAGTSRTSLAVSKEEPDQIKNIRVELEYRDPNGEIQTVAQSLLVYPSARLVGVKPNSWFATRDSLKFQVAVTDLHGKAIENAPVEVQFIERKYFSHRKRLIGGFYSYENKIEFKRLGNACSGTTNKNGLLECDVKPPIGGNLVLEAKTFDEKKRPAFSTSSTWVYDSSEVWFAQEDSDRIDILPERKRYEDGETATFQVRMPFREATALVTVEREGILDSYVIPISGKKPTFQIPILTRYSPNVFVSALVVRGRVGEQQPTAMVDLGKPAFKLGISELQVGWKPHELNVKVLPSKAVYQVREKGHFKIQVQTADGKPLPSESEVAIAAVDEGLLQLKSNTSWNLLEAMMTLRSYDVQTYTAQSEVIGKRHFGLKALPPGGDGGRAPAREVFDSLLYWNGTVILDSNGEAEIEFPMNDSVTGFKVAAIAHSGASLFGTGTASIRTTQDLMILSGIPPLAREKDHLLLELTLRNTTQNPMNLAVLGKATGVTSYSPSEFLLGPNEVKQIKWPVDIPSGVSTLVYDVSASLQQTEKQDNESDENQRDQNQRDQKSTATDHIRVSQKILPAVPVRVFQASLSQVDKKFQTSVERPQSAIPHEGGIRVIADSTILSSLDSVREYMNHYPYSCLEQKVSQAIVSRDKKKWQTILEELPVYQDSDGLVKYFPTGSSVGSDILTSYLIALSHEAKWELPEESRNKMIQGLKGFVEGRIVRTESYSMADLTIRKLSAIEALSRYGQADWAMTNSLKNSVQLWPTSAVIDWLNLLRTIRGIKAEERETHLKQADQILRARLTFQGTTMTFSTENIDQLGWMMASSSANANRLLLSIYNDSHWKDEIGKIVKGSMQRQQQGHWGTSTANAWGVLAMEKIARTFESKPVRGTTEVVLGEANPSVLNWSSTEKNKTLDFSWPTGPSTLSLTHSGAGKPWITLQSRAAIPLKEPLFSGYQIIKKWIPIEQKVPGKWSKGDIARVKLNLEAQAEMTWVVVNDPIPAGATILGSGLGNDSKFSISNEKSDSESFPEFQERAFEGYRAYYSYIPKGKWSAEYTVRFNQSGKMSLPPTRVEAMYLPETFGELPNEPMSVLE